MNRFKIKNKQLLEIYVVHNNKCEDCGETYNLELHHILGGTYRTDELWNLVRLCKKCHYKAHENTKESRKVWLKYKYQKGEIFECDKEKMRQHNLMYLLEEQ